MSDKPTQKEWLCFSYKNIEHIDIFMEGGSAHLDPVYPRKYKTDTDYKPIVISIREATPEDVERLGGKP